MKDRLPPSLYVPPYQRLGSLPPDYAFHPLPLSHSQSQQTLLPIRCVSAYDDCVSEEAFHREPVPVTSFSLNSHPFLHTYAID